MPELLREWKSRHISEEFSIIVDTQRCMSGVSQQVKLEDLPSCQVDPSPIKPFPSVASARVARVTHKVHINQACETGSLGRRPCKKFSC